MISIIKNKESNNIKSVIVKNQSYQVNTYSTPYKLVLIFDYELFGKNIYINICNYITGEYLLYSNLLFIKPFTTETLELINLDETDIYQINIIDTKNYGLQSPKGIQVTYYNQQQILQHYTINGNFGKIHQQLIYNQHQTLTLTPLKIPLCPGYFNLDLLSFKILERRGWDYANIELKYKSNSIGRIRWDLYSYVISGEMSDFKSGVVEITDIFQDLIILNLTIYNLNLWKYLRFILDDKYIRTSELINFYTFEFLDTNSRLYLYPNGTIDLYLVIDTINNTENMLITFNINHNNSFYLDKTELINNRIKYKLSIPYQPDFSISSSISFSYYFVYQGYYYHQDCLENVEYQLFKTSHKIETKYKEYESYRSETIQLYNRLPKKYQIETILYQGTPNQLQQLRESNKPYKILIQNEIRQPFELLVAYILENKSQFYFSTHISFNEQISNKILLLDFLDKSYYDHIFCSFRADDLKQFKILGFYDLENYNLNLWYSKKGSFSPLHHDGNKYNFNLCFQGKKKWYLRPPNDNLDNLDLEETNQQFIEIETNPNEILYLPEFWLHQVETLEDSICYSYWYDDNLIHNDIRFIQE